MSRQRPSGQENRGASAKGQALPYLSELSGDRITAVAGLEDKCLHVLRERIPVLTAKDMQIRSSHLQVFFMDIASLSLLGRDLRLLTSFSVFEPVNSTSECPMQKRQHPENTVFSGLYGQKATTLISYQNQRCLVALVGNNDTMDD